MQLPRVVMTVSEGIVGRRIRNVVLRRKYEVAENCNVKMMTEERGMSGTCLLKKKNGLEP
jgi:hypothetical protein